MRTLGLFLGALLLAMVVGSVGAVAVMAPTSAAVTPPASPTWPSYVTAVDNALARDDIGGAVRAWHDLYGAALGSRRWEAMVDAGDAFRRVAERAGTPGAGRPNARQAYLVALMRAEHAASADGVRRVADAFAQLGDHGVAAQCRRIAERMSAGS